MKTRRWALTLLLIVTLLTTTPGFGLVFAAGPDEPATVDVTIAPGETQEVLVVMKPVSLFGIATADTVDALQKRSASAQATILSTITAAGGTVENTFWINNSVLAVVDAATLDTLAHTPGVQSIVENAKTYKLDDVSLQAAGNKLTGAPPANTWGLDMISAPVAQTNYSVNGTGVKVAVLDTGIDITHPDLAGKLYSAVPSAPWYPGGWMTWNASGAIGWWDGRSDPSGIIPQPLDTDFHGTHVAGTIAGGNGSGTHIGVAPGVTLMAGVIVPGGSGNLAQCLAGMQWALAPYNKMNEPAGTRADIVNMSIGFASDSYVSELISPLENMRAAGTIVVAAIGNAGHGHTSSPGNLYNAGGIGAVGPDANVASFSGGNIISKWVGAPVSWPDTWIKPDISAPGGSGSRIVATENVFSSVPTGYWAANPPEGGWGGPPPPPYGYAAGTSMATPHVAGSLALILQYQRLHSGSTSPDTIINAAMNTTTHKPAGGKDTYYGVGIINVDAAIASLAGAPPTTTTTTTTTTPPPTTTTTTPPPAGGAPAIDVSPSWPDMIELAPGTSGDFSLSIGNTGTATLNWNITEQPGAPPAAIGKPAPAGLIVTESLPAGLSSAAAKVPSAPVAPAKDMGPLAGEGHVYLTDANSSVSPTPFYQYDVATNTWAPKAPIPGRNTTQLASGDAGGVFALPEDGNIYKYDRVANTWTFVRNGPAAAVGRNAVSMFKMNKGEFYWAKDGTTTLYYTSGGVWRSVTTPRPISSGSAVDRFSGLIVIRTYGQLGCFVFDPISGTFPIIRDNPTSTWENSRVGSLVGPEFFTRTQSGSWQAVNLGTGATRDTGVTPAGQHVGSTADPGGHIYSVGYSATASTFEAYNVATNTLVTLAPAPVIPGNEHSTIVWQGSGGGFVDIPWISEVPMSGSIAAGAPNTNVNVHINTTGMPLGDYFAKIMVNSNDPGNPAVALNVHLKVGVAPGQISVSPMDPITINVKRGDQASLPAAFNVASVGEGNLNYNIGDQFAGPAGGGGAASISGQVIAAPESGPARVLPNNGSVTPSGAVPLVGPPDGYKAEGDNLVIGISNYGELDWKNPSPSRPGGGAGYGFEYKPARPAGGNAESLAVGWNGEGYVVSYDGNVISEYPDNRTAAVIPMSAIVLVDNPDMLTYQVNARTSDNRLAITFTIKFDKHSRSVRMSTNFVNTGPSFIGELKYKRVVDWDGGGRAGSDIDWSYNPDKRLLATVSPPSGGGSTFFAYGFGAMGDSWPMVYDWDLNAWDDYTSIDHGTNWLQKDGSGAFYTPDHPYSGPGGTGFDGNVALYFMVGSLAPGEQRQVNTVYTVGQGDTANAAYADMLTNLGGGAAADVPWLSETPQTGMLEPGSNADIGIAVDARGLPVGKYFAQIVIRSNDPGMPMVVVPVQVNVLALNKAFINDPEDVDPKPPAAPAPKIDINTVSVQLSKSTMMLDTTFYGAIAMDQPIVTVTMMDTDENVATGYTGPMSNDIGADYMAFGYIYPPAGPASLTVAQATAALKSYSALGPKVIGTVAASIAKASGAAGPGPGAMGELYLFKWDNATKTWSPLMQNYNIGINPPAGPEDSEHIWQLLSLVVMADDGSMAVVQSAGNIWEITDTAPDRGHGRTVPAADVAVTGIGSLAAEVVGTPEYKTGQSVNLTATVANHGDDVVNNILVHFAVIPILGETPTSPGDPGYPDPVLRLGAPVTLDPPVLIDAINPGDSFDATTTWTPELLAAAGGDGYIHDYLLKAYVDPLPRESNTSDNAATERVSVVLGTAIRVSDLTISEETPAGLKPMDGGTFYSGQSYVISVTVHNDGGLDIPAGYNVTFSLNGGVIGGQPIPEIASGGDPQTITQAFIPTLNGNSLLLDAQADVLPGEANADDNDVNMTINIAPGQDVAVTTLTASPATINYGNDVTLTATVTNPGYMDLSGVEVKFYIGSDVIDTQVIDSLASGDSTTVSTVWEAMSVGNKTAKAAIDPLPYEGVVSNNFKTLALSVNGKDIGITTMTVTPPAGSPLGKKGKSHTVKVTVVNNGTSTQTFQVRLTANGTLVGRSPTAVSSLTKGSSKVVTLNAWIPATVGGVTLRAEVGNTVGGVWVTPLPDDINTDNDSKEVTVTVIASAFDATVTGVKTASTPIAGRATQVQVAVANTGNEAASFSVSLLADGKLVRTIPVANLVVAGKRTVPFSWVPATAGAHTLTATISGGNLDDGGSVRSLDATVNVVVPVSLKLTAGAKGPNGTVAVTIQLKDPTGKTDVKLAGVALNVTVPAGTMASSAVVTTDANGTAVVYITLTKASAVVTISSPGLASGSIVIR